jgi:hypothetical protein
VKFEYALMWFFSNTMSSTEHPANRGKPWLDDEILQLLQNVRKKKTVEEIAEQHQRTVGGITSRLRELAAGYHAEGRPIEDIMRFTGLTEEVINDAVERRKIAEENQKKRAEAKAVINTGKYTNKYQFVDIPPQPTMTDVMEILKDIQGKLAFVLERV